jgi:SPP1 gp7 family putative phage head morphogenesis protein
MDKDLLRLLEEQAQQLIRTETKNVAKVFEMYRLTRADLVDRLAAIPDQQSFTAMHFQTALFQIEAGINEMQQRFYAQLGANLPTMAEMSHRHMGEQLKQASKNFGELLRPIPIDVAKVTIAGKSLLLPQFERSVQRYGTQLIGDMQQRMAVSLLGREFGFRAKERLFRDYLKPLGTVKAGTRDVPVTAYWAERIVRTETVSAYNTLFQEHLAEAKLGEPTMQKRWSAVGDRRTSWICKEMDGKVAEVEQPFHLPTGRDVMSPPAHPNCRSTTMAWMPQWNRGFKAPAANAPPPAPPAPPPLLDAATIMGQQVGQQAGSNKGGVYRGTDGIDRYVKLYTDPAQAYGEHLANTLYRELGLGAPVSHVFEHQGNLAYASDMLHGVQTLQQAGATQVRAQELARGFLADVLTANWDVVGLNNDNVVVTKGGTLVRIDNGGTFLMRAQAGRKPVGVLNAVTEYDSLFRSKNPAYSTMMRLAGYDAPEDFRADLKRQLADVEQLRAKYGSWDKFVSNHAPKLNAKDAGVIGEMLERRLGQLKELVENVVFREESPVADKVLTYLRGLQNDAAAMKGAYKDIVAKSGTPTKAHDEVRSSVKGWTASYRRDAAHKRVEDAVALLRLGTGAADPALVDAMKQASMPQHRKARWAEFYKKAGVNAEVPTHIDAYRGVKGLDFVKDVARSWKDTGAVASVVRTDPAASWSFTKSTADGFASTSDAVVFKWRIPFEKTYFDQVGDDGSFISSYFQEHEVIVGDGTRQLDLPKEQHVVKYRGKSYTYEDRQALLNALARDGVKL